MNFVKITGYSASIRLNVFNADSIDSRHSLVRLYARPCRFKYVTAMDSVVKGIEPKFRLSFGLAAQFPPQKGDFYRHSGFRDEPFSYPFHYGASVAQADLLSFRVKMTEVRLLGSTGITPLPRYYEPLRIPTVNAERVIDSPTTTTLVRNPFALGITSDLPGSSVDLSTRALPYHPGQSHRFLRSFIPGGWQASSSSEDWSLPYKRNEVETGSLALGSRLRRLGSETTHCHCNLLQKAGLTPHVWLPARDRPRLHIERAIYMSDTFQSDRSTRLGLVWRTKERKGRKERKQLKIQSLVLAACEEYIKLFFRHKDDTNPRQQEREHRITLTERNFFLLDDNDAPLKLHLSEELELMVDEICSYIDISATDFIKQALFFWIGYSKNSLKRNPGAHRGYEDSPSFSLIKGGLRTITGQICKRSNQESYRIKTPTATIGVRGTIYDAQYCTEDSCGSIKPGIYPLTLT